MTVVIFGNKALEVHAPFHRSPARERCLFGAVGSGKSYAICDEAIAWCLEQPGIRGLITRKTVPELRDTTEPVFEERVPPDLWRAGELRRTGGHFDTFTFPNGSQVLFRSIDDWRKHKSLNLGFIAWDEWGEFDEDTVNGMSTRLRQVDPTPRARELGYTAKIHRRGMWGASNPEGRDWLWRRYHPDSPEWKSADSKKRGGRASFFSTSLDNPYLDPDYLESLFTMPKLYVKRYVLCQFDDFAGRIYEDFNWDEHTVEHPNWRQLGIERPLVWMGMDPGTESPTAGLWCWIDPETRTLTGIAEYEQPGLAVDQHVAAWRVIEAQQRMLVRWRVADPNAVTQRDRGSAIQLATQYSKQGYTFNLGASSHQDRIPALAHLIYLRRFKLSRQACPKTFEAIKNYQWKDLTPAQRARGEDPSQEPLKKNTHLVECAQYVAGKEAPMLPVHRRNAPKDFNEEVHRTIRKNIRDKHQRRLQQRHGLGGITL